MFVKIDIKNIFVWSNEYYFLSVEIKRVNEIIVANNIFSVWYESRCDFLIENKNKTSYDALLKVIIFIVITN